MPDPPVKFEMVIMFKAFETVNGFGVVDYWCHYIKWWFLW